MPNMVDVHLIFAATKAGNETPWLVGAWDEISIEDNWTGYSAALEEHKAKQDRIVVVKTTIDLDLVEQAFDPPLPEVESTPVEPVVPE